MELFMKNGKRIGRITTGFLVLLITLGCHEIVEPPRYELYVTEIEITGEYEATQRLEVEVHLVDANSGRLIGCAGARTGLRDVDYSDIFYRVNADFITPNGDFLYYEDIRYRDIEIWVIEDDLDPCPGPYVPHYDDIIGISPPIDGRDFRHQIELSFGNVIHIRLGS